MTRDEDLARLPEAYARALRLAEADWDPAQIAAELGIDVASVAPLLKIAEIKLARLGEGRAD